MGIYSMLDELMGLYTKPRLRKIGNQVAKGEDLTKEDLEYLVNEVARYQTIEHRVRRHKLELDDTYLGDGYMLHDVLGDYLDELDGIKFTQFSKENVYLHNFNLFTKHNRDIVTYGDNQLWNTVNRSIEEVKALEECYTTENTDISDSDKPIKVLGYFNGIYDKYGKRVYVESDSVTDDIYNDIIHIVKTALEEELKEKQKFIDEFSDRYRE